MLLGIKCSCGHELDIDKKAIKLLIECNLEHLVIVCYACKKETLVKLKDDELASYRITGVEKKGNFARYEHESNPISTCLVP